MAICLRNDPVLASHLFKCIFAYASPGFVIWHFRNDYFVLIVSLRSPSIEVRIISTANVLVDRIKKFKWNASPND